MSYPGGKNGSGVYQRIINEMPPHTTYVEPFLGGGAVMLMKKSAIASIGIDADGDVISHWHSLESAPPNLTLLHADALDWMASTTFSSDTLVYCDPPYLMSTRSSHRRIYRYEMTEKDHERLLEIITHLTHPMVMISGYWSKLYANALAGWRSISFTTRTRGGRTATEWLWMNYPEPLELAEYTFLGENFRERERVRRKIDRWKNRWIKMPLLERRAIMAAISEIRQR